MFVQCRQRFQVANDAQRADGDSVWRKASQGEHGLHGRHQRQEAAGILAPQVPHLAPLHVPGWQLTSSLQLSRCGQDGYRSQGSRVSITCSHRSNAHGLQRLESRQCPACAKATAQRGTGADVSHNKAEGPPLSGGQTYCACRAQWLECRSVPRSVPHLREWLLL